MGKKKDTSTEEEAVVDGDLVPVPVKKHKKHKHKKHKKKKLEGVIEEKMKSRKTAPAVHEGDIMDPSPGKGPLTICPPTKSTKKKKKGKESATSSDEERWLDAIESGKLEEVDDELKKIKTKDPKLMTARQRAMLERKTTFKEAGQGDSISTGEQLLALPSGYREKVMTPEMLLKAQLKSQKRKQQADEKREKDKKRTMERLLRKQESKPTKHSARNRPVKRKGPSVLLCIKQDSTTISLPPNMEFPFQPVRAKSPPPLPKTCGVNGCTNARKYTCSKTGVPVCSLQCYKNISISEAQV